MKPMTCDFAGCIFQCFEIATMIEHAKTHYPEAAANDEKAREHRRIRGAQNSWSQALLKEEDQ